MTASQLEIGKWYANGNTVLQASEIRNNSHQELSLFFSDKSSFRLSDDYDRFIEVPEPVKVAEVVYVESDKKPHDSAYFKLKDRHSILCSKKLELNRTGRNKTMRNAYINQELEQIRQELSQYQYQS